MATACANHCTGGTLRHESRLMPPTQRILIGVLRCAPVISLLLAPAATTAQSQQAPGLIEAGTSTIRGQLLDSVTRAPVAGCAIRVGTEGRFANLVSDQGGAYELKDVAAASYFFFIQCPSHRALCPGGEMSRCQIDVLRDQERDGVDFDLVAGATARGQVLTFDGRPVTRASVRLGRGMQDEPTPMVTPSITDTEGRFALVNLPAGTWRLEVEIPPTPGGLTPPIVYYPGGLSWEEAAGLTLEAGRVVDRLTVVVPRISENVLTVVMPPPDATITNPSVSLLRQSPLAVRQVTLNREGIGTITGVLPGRYFVSARAESSDKHWAAFEVVDFIEDGYEVRLQLVPTGGITGRIVVESGALPSLETAMVGASWIHDGEEVNPLSFDETRTSTDGSFRINYLFGTRKLQLHGLDSGWEIAAVRQGRTDVTTSGIVVVPDGVIEATIVIRRR